MERSRAGSLNTETGVSSHGETHLGSKIQYSNVEKLFEFETCDGNAFHIRITITALFYYGISTTMTMNSATSVFHLMGLFVLNQRHHVIIICFLSFQQCNDTTFVKEINCC